MNNSLPEFWRTRNEYFEAFPLLIHTDDAFRDTVRNEDIFEG